MLAYLPGSLAAHAQCFNIAVCKWCTATHAVTVRLPLVLLYLAFSYGSPMVEDIDAFLLAYDQLMREAGEKGHLPEEIQIEVRKGEG